MSSTAERQGIARSLVGSWWHLPQIPSETKKLFWRWYYSRISSKRDPEIMLLDYGYAAENSEAAAAQDDDYGLALYEVVAGAVELTGKDVLEVGCGRGGGASHIFERFSPRALTGVDLAKPAIVMARQRYGRPGLHFAIADAEDLPYADGSFDAVLNVESSHCYPDVGRFLSEVHRVLRPDGVLLLTDFRSSGAAPREGAKQARGE